MTHSNLVSYKNITTKRNSRRGNKIKHIVIHHYAGVVSVKNGTDYLANTSREVSANYVIGNEGKIGLNVPEEYRAWTTGSRWIDERAITFEVSNSKMGHPWPVSDEALESVIKLTTDICNRYGIYPCTYTGDKSGTLHKHEWYANTNCPGPYLGGKFKYIAEEVTRRLDKLRGTSSQKANAEKTVEVKMSGNVKINVSENELVRALRGAGYTVTKGAAKTTQSSIPHAGKSDWQLATEVIAGKHGNGAARRKSLGSRYDAVQKIVNQRI